MGNCSIALTCVRHLKLCLHLCLRSRVRALVGILRGGRSNELGTLLTVVTEGMHAPMTDSPSLLSGV